MTPFQQWRLWARRAPVAERLVALGTAALLVAGVVWALAPTNNHHPGSAVGVAGAASAASSAGPARSAGSAVALGPSGSGIASGPSRPGGGPASNGTGPSASLAATQSGGAAGSASSTAGPASSVGANPAAASGCATPPGSDQGVSGNQIKIAIVLVNVVGPAGNSTFGVATASQQQAYYQDVIDGINASGGVACHYKLNPIYFPTDAVDPSALQQTCLNVEQAGVFAVVDYGAYFTYPALANCYPNNHIPYFSVTLPPVAEQQQFYPYIFSTGSTMEVLYHNALTALRNRGFYSPANGFGRLGIVYRDCTPGIINEIQGWLHQFGVGSSQIVTYDLSCPTGFASPSNIEQAVLKFQEQHVTHAMEVQAAEDFGNFTTVAQQQGFRPKYGLADDALVALTYGNEHPDFNNVANAIAITGNRFGEEHTAGYPESQGTVACNALFQARGQPPVYRQTLGAGGSACDDLWLLAAGIDHAPLLHRDQLAAGLHAAGSVEMSYPYGPNDFSEPRVTTGSEFWRPLQFFTSCDCWLILDRTFHPQFPGS